MPAPAMSALWRQGYRLPPQTHRRRIARGCVAASGSNARYPWITAASPGLPVFRRASPRALVAWHAGNIQVFRSMPSAVVVVRNNQSLRIL